MTRTTPPMALAMLCAAALTAQFISGKATRDALFLTSLDFTALPAMLMGASVGSILLVFAYGRFARNVAPGRLVPGAFIASGVLLVSEWLARSAAPSATAIIVYLHISAAGPLLASGFWLIVGECFDPRAARRGFGRIAAAGSAGGILAALGSARVATLFGAPAMLVVLAGIQLLTAWLVWRLSAWARLPADGVSPESAPRLRCGVRIVADTPHLRQLALLVLLGTTSAALLEYLFKARAVETFGPGDNLLRFFAFYYAAISVITLVLQTLSTRPVLERFGLALTTSTPSIAMLAGSLGSLAAPGFGGLVVARAGESIFRASWFRAGYELFYTPLPLKEKSAAKSVIDVALDRLGDAVGGALVRLAIVFVPAAQSSTILSLAAASSLGAIIVASTLNRWYISTLERSLMARAGGIGAGDSPLETHRTVRITVPGTATRDTVAVRIEEALRTASIDREVQDILWLRSTNRDRIVDVLARPEQLAPALVPHAIPLLASEPLAPYALFALRKVAEEHVGELTDALLDPTQSSDVRRYLARVFSVCVSQRAVDGLLLALDDVRFDVRFHSARSLSAILEKNPRVRIDRERIYKVVLREAAAGRRGLAHVFTLLSLVLPREPIQMAFRSLQGEDTHLRGTALEYLEGILPPPIRQRLWPLLFQADAGDAAPRRASAVSGLFRPGESRRSGRTGARTI